jgi:hypothetical protein
MPYQVKVYDGEGNLLRTIQPEFDANSKPPRKFVTHPCPECGSSTSNKKYCSKCILEREEKRKPA